MGIRGDFSYKRGEIIAEILQNFVDNTVNNMRLCPIKTYPHDSQVAKFIY